LKQNESTTEQESQEIETFLNEHARTDAGKSTKGKFPDAEQACCEFFWLGHELDWLLRLRVKRLGRKRRIELDRRFGELESGDR
jgi:hypothetical protein